MTLDDSKTLRLLMPQWQGGNNPPYYFGAQLLAWLAPETSGPVVEVPVQAPRAGEELPLEEGIVGRTALLGQLASAQAIIAEQAPDRIVVLGGDCLVDLAPFAYLNERYDGQLAVLWVDAHPDVMTSAEYPHAHAMVLGNLLGQGDASFSKRVKRPLDPARVMYAGVNEESAYERDFIHRLGLQVARPAELELSSKPVLDWLKSTGASRLAIHLDLDVLDPTQFRSLLFANPQSPPDAFAGVAMGRMSISAVVRLLANVEQAIDVVGIGITEHLPWDVLALKQMLQRLPLIGKRVS